MPSPLRILLAESDDVLRVSLAEQLQHEGYDVLGARCAQDAADAGTAFAFAVIGLDDAPAVAGRLRNGGLSCPVLLIAEGEVAGFETVARPFRFSALLARLHALSTHHAAASDRAVRIGPYTFHPSAKLLQADDRKVRLTEKETNILKFLHASAGTVSRDICCMRYGGYGPAVATHTLEPTSTACARRSSRTPPRPRFC